MPGDSEPNDFLFQVTPGLNTQNLTSCLALFPQLMRLSRKLSFAFRSQPASSNLKARFVSTTHLQVYLSGVAAEKKYQGHHLFLARNCTSCSQWCGFRQDTWDVFLSGIFNLVRLTSDDKASDARMGREVPAVTGEARFPQRLGEEVHQSGLKVN